MHFNNSVFLYEMPKTCAWSQFCIIIQSAVKVKIGLEVKIQYAQQEDINIVNFCVSKKYYLL